MCNHYEKNAKVVGWAADLARVPSENFLLGENNARVQPDDLANMPLHVWPKSKAPIVLQTEAGRSIALLRWGVRVEIKGKTKPLVKFVTNARDDKLSSFTWRFSVAERRCLIPAVAYYEPDGPVGGKWEVRFTLSDQPMFFFAGIWETDRTDGARSFSMLTTSPNELAAKLHDRMPLILKPAAALDWLGHTPLPPERLREFCQPYPAGVMTSEALPPPAKKIKKDDLRASEGDLLLE